MSANLMSLAQSGGKFLKLYGDRKMMKPLPYDAEVEYLESTGTQYIQTDYTPTIFHNFKAVVAMMDLGDAQYASSIGTAKVTTSNGMIPLMIRDGSVSGWHVANFVNIGGSAGEVHTITSKLSHAIGYPDYWEYSWYDLDRRIVGSYQKKSNPTVWLGKMTVFACSYDNGDVNRLSKSRFYSFSATDVNSDELVVDLIPVRKGTVGYIYDRVSGQLFHNQGTGAFIIGPDKTI